MLVEFPSVVNAVACATEFSGYSPSQSDASQDHRIEFRIGVNVGDVIAQGEDIFGDGVNVAARLEGVAPVGGIAVSHPCAITLASDSIWFSKIWANGNLRTLSARFASTVSRWISLSQRSRERRASPARTKAVHRGSAVHQYERRPGAGIF